MNQSFISLSIINRLLQLPQNSTANFALKEIGQLFKLRRQHAICKSFKSSIQEEIDSMRGQLQSILDNQFKNSIQAEVSKFKDVNISNFTGVSDSQVKQRLIFKEAEQFLNQNKFTKPFKKKQRLKKTPILQLVILPWSIEEKEKESIFKANGLQESKLIQKN